MTASRASRLTLPALLAAAALSLAACSSPEPQATIPPEAGAVPSSPVATPEATASTPALPDPTCENIIGEASFTELEGQGWEYEQEPFLLADEEISAGVMCTWTNPAEPGGNILQFGWAPLTAAEAESTQEALESDGWIREDDGDGAFLTEDPAFALTVDEAGYGITYYFGEGYVQVADTKANLAIVERR